MTLVFREPERASVVAGEWGIGGLPGRGLERRCGMRVLEGVEAGARKAELVEGKEVLTKCENLFSRQESIIAAQNPTLTAPASPRAIRAELSESGVALTLDS